MGHSSVFGFVAFALCIVACVSATGAAEVDKKDQAPVYIVEQAKKAVVKVKQSIKNVSDNAQSYIDNVERKLGKGEKCKDKIEKALSKTEPAGKDNEDTKNLVDKIKEDSYSDGTLKLDANTVLQYGVGSLCELLIEAKKLDGECDKELSLIKKDLEDYKDTKNNVSYLQNKAEIFTTHFNDIFTNMNLIQSTAEHTEESLKKAQLSNLHVCAIVSVAKIQTMIKEADGNIKETQNTKYEVNGIVKEMKKHCTTKLIQSYEIIKEQCDSATDALTSAKGAVDKAQNAMTAMKNQKGLASTELENVQKATDVSKAHEDVTKVQECFVKVKEIADQVKSAMETDKNMVAKAKDSKQKLLTALPTTTTAPSTAQNTETAKSNLPVSEGTETDQKDAITQPKITNTEPPTSNKSPDQSDNSAAKLKDALSNGAQNVSTTALTGGKAPAPGANNDNAMTVSVPLLVALIASAVLQ